jgi:hypothetical protein
MTIGNTRHFQSQNSNTGDEKMSDEQGANGSLNAYKDILSTMSDEELDIEKVEAINEHLAAQVAIHNARRTGVTPEEDQALVEKAKNALETASAVLKEIHDRAVSENEREAQIEGEFEGQNLAKRLYEARLSNIDDWQRRSQDLTELLRTGGSMAIQQAGELPVEGGYNIKQWGYDPITRSAQAAESELLKARKDIVKALKKIELAMRIVDKIRAEIRSAGYEGQDLQETAKIAQEKRDNIPF